MGDKRGDGAAVELMLLLLPGLEVCYRFIFPPRRRCKILSLVIFLLCISSQEGSSCSCSLRLSAHTPPSIIPPHPRGGRRRRRCSEVRCCEILCAVRPPALRGITLVRIRGIFVLTFEATAKKRMNIAPSGENGRRSISFKREENGEKRREEAIKHFRPLPTSALLLGNFEASRFHILSG